MLEPYCVVHVLPKKKAALDIERLLSIFVDVRGYLNFLSMKLCNFVCLGAGVPITSPLMYSAGHTDDTRQALLYVAHQFPNAKLLGLGFSLGSNLLTKYLGEERHQTRIRAACVLACVSPSLS
jgi:hypothetical protein